MTSKNVSHKSGLFVLVASFSADQAKQSSSRKAYQAQSRSTFPDGNVLPGTFEQVNFVTWKKQLQICLYLSFTE